MPVVAVRSTAISRAEETKCHASVRHPNLGRQQTKNNNGTCDKTPNRAAQTCPERGRTFGVPPLVTFCSAEALASQYVAYRSTRCSWCIRECSGVRECQGGQGARTAVRMFNRRKSRVVCSQSRRYNAPQCPVNVVTGKRTRKNSSGRTRPATPTSFRNVASLVRRKWCCMSEDRNSVLNVWWWNARSRMAKRHGASM